MPNNLSINSFSIDKRGVAEVLDSQVKNFLDDLPADSPMAEVTPNDIRSNPSPVDAYQLESLPVMIEEQFVKVKDGFRIKIRIYRSSKEQAPALVFYHGGCWVFCDLDSHDSLCRTLCLETGHTVIAIEYRLAPEYKFPTGLNDAYEVTSWISQNKSALNLTHADLTLCGDSAGGNLAAVISNRALTRGDFGVQAQVLFYPICDISNLETQSYRQFESGFFLSKEAMAWAAKHYIRTEDDYSSIDVSPLLNKNIKAPPTLIQTAEFDILRDEAETFAKKLAERGIQVQCVRYNGLIHAYAALAGGIDFAREAVFDACCYIRDMNTL